MKISVIGDGVFGTFLKEEIIRVWPNKMVHELEADTLILAVPSSAYNSVAQRFQGKHLVNVCSVQAKTNWVCSTWSKNVTGIHPLFGPRSGLEGRSAIVTRECDKSEEIKQLFQDMGVNVLSLTDGDGWRHDEIMSKTHIPVVRLQEQIKIIMEEAEKINEAFMPTSFKKLIEFAETFGDMPQGTFSSILDNPMKD